MMTRMSVLRFLTWSSKQVAFKDNAVSNWARYAVGARDGDHNSTKRGLPLPRGYGAKGVNQVVDERAHLRRR